MPRAWPILTYEDADRFISENGCTYAAEPSDDVLCSIVSLSLHTDAVNSHAHY